ncbi:glycoside hydrolase family 13 protein [Nocardioides sp. GXZ039]|uniref:glycoside hydrolase family 13 protein n=1 Tax=Nocardioides sp. GXZ039 TaxID=3136018 RepID=UPI0030F3B45B
MSSAPDAARQQSPWWREAVIYQVYARSFASSGTRAGGPDVGDLPGITARLPYLRDLGVDAVWITPFYTSPQHDHGYDVADYLDVDPLFGTLADADDLIAAAHDLGLRVIVDLVPNHTSDEHEWFQAALAAPPGGPERARYLFRDGKGPDGDEPPNNWQSVFGGPAWTRVEDDGRPGQWYLHLFDSTQPDLDWRNPEVGDMFEQVLRFWLDRGADGFRVDVAHGLLKEAGLRDQILSPGSEGRDLNQVREEAMIARTDFDEPMWDQPEVHDVYRRWRRVLEEYPGDRMDVAEAWAKSLDSVALYVRPDEMHQAFNFLWLLADWSAAEFADVVTDTFAALDPVGATPTWVLSNHDVVRHATRYGGGERGLARARAATLTMLGLPGSAYLYQGEELGLEQVDVAPEDRQDPSWFRTGEVGRDGCRVPMPWSGSAAPYGFSPDGEGQPWIPQPDDWAALTVEAQTGDPDSTLEFYRRALALRRTLPDVRGVTVEVDGDLLLITRGEVLIALNCGSEAVALPAGEVLISSRAVEGDRLPADTAAWIRTARPS